MYLVSSDRARPENTHLGGPPELQEAGRHIVVLVVLKSVPLVLLGNLGTFGSLDGDLGRDGSLGRKGRRGSFDRDLPQV